MAAGLDSLAGTQFVQAVSDRFCTEFPSTLIFDHPSLRAVSEFLSKSLCASSATEILEVLNASALRLLGTSISKEEPLMAAGLDSLAGT